MPDLNIQVFVDAISLLSESPVKKSVFIYDDSPCENREVGTHDAASRVYPGQLVRWVVNPIDVQTSVWISGISFGSKETATMPHHPSPAPSIENTLALENGEVEETSDTLTDFEVDHARAPWLWVWEGYAPYCMIPNLRYPYSLRLRFGRNPTKTIVVDGPALLFEPYPPLPHVEAGSVI